MAISLDPANEIKWVKEGRVFHATHGALTTPAAFETDLAVGTPDLAVRVPGGTVMVPLRVRIETEATGAAVFQVLIRGCDNDIGTSGRTAFTPINVNTRYAAVGGKCGALITSTGNCTTPTNTADLLRVYVQPDIDAVTGTAHFDQVVYSPLQGRGIPAVIGSSSIMHGFLVYVGNGTSATGYIEAYWAEFTYDEFYAA